MYPISRYTTATVNRDSIISEGEREITDHDHLCTTQKAVYSIRVPFDSNIQ